LGPSDPKLPLWDEDDDDGKHRPIDMPTTELGRVASGSSHHDGTLRDGAGSDPEKGLPQAGKEPRLKPARNPPKSTIYDDIPLLRFFRWIARTVSRRARVRQLAEGRKPKRKAYEDLVESYVPLEIILVLSK